MTRADDRRLMRTDDAGTVVLDANGQVAAEHGTDMHETLLAAHQDDGWEVAADGHRPPPGVGDEPAPWDTSAPGQKATEADPRTS